MSERKYFSCQDLNDSPQFICVSPREKYIELVDESNSKHLICRLPYWNQAEDSLAHLYDAIPREKYLDARLKIISRFPPKYRAVA